MEITLGLAFAAGFISFISPCVLPLVPAYISYMGGRVTNTVAAQAGGGLQVQANAFTRISTGVHSLFFVIGFSLVFVGVGLLSTSFVQVVGGSNINAVTQVIGRAGGIVIIVFGLHFMGGLSWLFNQLRQSESYLNTAFSLAVAVVGTALIVWALRIPPSPLATDPNIFRQMMLVLPAATAFNLWLLLDGAFTNPRAFWLNLFNKLEVALYADTRQQMTATGQTGYGGTALMGVVFAAGWTPCIGPIYGAILTLAANGGSVGQAGTMLLAYSLGLGIPFIVTALLLDSAQGMLRGLNQYMGTIKLASGVFLVLIGFAVASGQLQRLSTVGANGTFAYNLEECFTSAVAGEVPWGDVVSCINEDETAPQTTANTGANVAAAGVDTITDDADTTSANANPNADLTVGTNVGDIAPNFNTFTAAGQSASLQDYRGQTVLLNFWATWCGPCRIEMPEFQDAYDAHRDDGFTILAVNNQETAQQVQDFADELSLTFPLLMDLQGDIQFQYGVVNYPSTYLINPDGVITNRHLGPLTADAIEEMINEAVS
jgi:cytochrome c biogenesis protein CcdA/peroxiredoxin